MKKKYYWALSVFILTLLIMVKSSGSISANSISITLPDFKVTINGEVVNNDYCRYPLVVYEDITYFPMTYNNCRYLGIESTWTGNNTGLTIDTTGVTAAYNPIMSKMKNNKTFTANIPSFPISVNGNIINNSQQEYPIISFRDIAYFPMTWQYCVEMFNWEYDFDNNNGLTIKSANPFLRQIPFFTNKAKDSTVIAKNGYYYYVDTSGHVVQTPLSAFSKAMSVFQLELWSYGDGKHFNPYSFYEENGKAMLYFHSGGATMGSDHRYVLNERGNTGGTTQKIQNSYWETTLIRDQLYMYWEGPTPGPGNLRVMDSKDIDMDADTSRHLGEKDYWYHALCEINGLPRLELIDNELFVRASKVLNNYEHPDGLELENSAVYKVNTSTNSVTRVSQTKEKVSNAQIAGDYLYYVTSSGEYGPCTYNVYRHSLKEATETLIGDFLGAESQNVQFAVVGDNVYYVSGENLCLLPGNEQITPEAEVLSISITGDNREYFVCTFKETPNSKYRVMVFDQSGNVVFKSSDVGRNIIIEGKGLYFYNLTTETLCKTSL